MEDIFTQISDYLWTQSWQIAALVVLIAAATFALKNKSAHGRYLLWLILLAKCLVPAFITIPLAILPAKAPAPVYQPPQMPAPTFAPLDSEPLYESAAPVVYEMTEAKRPSVLTKLADITLSQWLAVVWLAGIVFFLLIASAKAIRANRWLKKHRIPLPSELAADINRIFERLGLRSPPNVWLIGKMSQPFVFGLFRGQIYLPANFTQIDTEKGRKGVLGHELSHVLRFDATVNFLQILAQAIFWFHPFVWWANKRIRAEREKCCDEMALATLDAKAKDYSSAIVNTLLAEHKSRIPVPSLAIAGPVKNIEDRIKTIMRPNKKFHKRPGLMAIISALLIAAIAVPTTLALTHRQPPEPTDPQTEPTPEPSDPNSITAEAEPEETPPVQFLSTVHIIELQNGSVVPDYPAIQSPDKDTPILNPDELVSFLELVETDPYARLLASPIILAMDAEKGIIRTVSDSYISGYKEPKSGYGEPIAIKDTVMGLTMSVTAHHVRARDIIRAEVELEHKEVLEFKQELYKDKYPYQVPMMTSKMMATMVAMESGQTVVLAEADSTDTRLLILLTCENLRPRQQSAGKLRELSREILIYAAEHDNKLPFSLVGRTIGALDVMWYVNNVTYLGAGLTDAVPGNTLIAYDKTLLEKTHQTNVLYADGHVDFIDKVALDKLLANPPVQQWRQAFEQVYRLEDNEVLKRIAPPFIPERVDYYEIDHKDQASAARHDLPDYFQFRWDGKLINWGLGFTSGRRPLSQVFGHILQVGRHNFEGPAELLDIQLPGDWILRKDARQEDLLKALEPIVAAETGRDIRFVSRLVAREVVIATGSFSPSQDHINIFVDQLDSDHGAGGGTGTVPEFLEWVADRIGTPIVDNTEPYGRPVSWYNHRDSKLAGLKYSPDIYDPRLDTLLRNLAEQTDLRFERTTRNIQKWFVVEGNAEPAPEHNPNIGGYSSYSPQPAETPGAPQIRLPKNWDEMAARYSPPQQPPDSNFTDYMNSISPSAFVNMVYDVSILLERALRVPLEVPRQLMPDSAEHARMPGGFGSFTPASLPEQRLKTMDEKKAELLQEIQATIDPNSWFDNGGEGTIAFYEDKKLVVRQTTEVHRKIEEFLVKAQRLASRRVAIETRLITAPEGFLDDISIDVKSCLCPDANTQTVAYPADGTNLDKYGELAPWSATILDERDTGRVLRATQTRADVRTLIAPKATVFDGERAEFATHKQIPYSYEQRNPETREIERKVGYVAEGTSLLVTPGITEDANAVVCQLRLEIADLLGLREVEVAETDAEKSPKLKMTLPETARTLAVTRVKIPAGKSLLIAGPKKIKQRVDTGAPFLKDLPLIGGIFKGKSEIVDDGLLLILIRPTIVLPEEIEPPQIAP